MKSKKKAGDHTVAIIKPDAVKNGFTKNIIDEIKANGFKINERKTFSFNVGILELFYREHHGKPFFDELKSYMLSGDVVALALEKDNAVAEFRELIGDTVGYQDSPDTLRYKYASSQYENGLHGSDSKESAFREYSLIFD